jgi:hypothetical protein
MKVSVEGSSEDLLDYLEQHPGELEKALRIKAVKEHDRRRKDRYKFQVLRDLEEIGSEEYQRLMDDLVKRITEIMGRPPERLPNKV